MTRWRSLEPGVYPALLLLILIAFYWRLTLTYQYDWMAGPELTQQVLPLFEEDARQMRAHRFPVWNPHASAGQPLLAQGQTGAAYPLNWLLFLSSPNKDHIDTLSLQWYFVAMHFVAALFCYLLCRDLGLSRFASLAAGLVFSLGGYLGTLNWPRMLNAAGWAPLVFLFLLRAVGGERPVMNGALCGLVWGMSWLSGDFDVPLLISLAAALTWLYYILRRRSWKTARPALLAATLAFLTGALQILPAAQYGRLAGAAVPYTVQEAFSIPPATVLGVILPGVTSFAGPFIGVAAFALATIAVVSAWSRSEVKLFTALAAGAFAYALGIHNIFQGMLYAVVPLVRHTRAPGAALVIFGLAAAVLVAFGVDRLVEARDAGFLRRMVWALAGLGLLIWALAYVVLLARALAWSGDDRVMMTGLLSLLSAALLFYWLRRNLSGRAAAALLIALLLVELGNVSGADFADRNDYRQSSAMQAVRSNEDIADFLGRQPRPFRVGMDKKELPENWAAYNNFDQVKADVDSPQGRALYGAMFTIGGGPPTPDATPVFNGKSGMTVFRNPLAFPRAWAVHEVVSTAKPGDAGQWIAEHLDEFHRKAFVAGSPAAVRSCDSPDAVTVTRYDAAHVTIRAAMGCDGMIVLSDSFYPGWKATVDKQPALVQDVNFGMRGVLVPRGTHEINYIYRPGAVYAGGAMSAGGVLAACAMVFFGRKRRNAIDMAPKRENNQD